MKTPKSKKRGPKSPKKVHMTPEQLQEHLEQKKLGYQSPIKSGSKAGMYPELNLADFPAYEEMADSPPFEFK